MTLSKLIMWWLYRTSSCDCVNGIYWFTCRFYYLIITWNLDRKSVLIPATLSYCCSIHLCFIQLMCVCVCWFYFPSCCILIFMLIQPKYLLHGRITVENNRWSYLKLKKKFHLHAWGIFFFNLHCKFKHIF